MVAAVLVVLGVIAALFRPDGSSPGPHVATGDSGASTSVRPPPSASPSASSSPVSAPAAASARDVLVALDRARSRAYARRDPALLTEVYSSALLLARDRGRLLTTVPRGCALTGLHTTFSEVRAPRLGSRTRVHARVAVRGAKLACSGAPSVPATSGAPVAMTIELRRTADGYRIDAEHSDPPPRGQRLSG